MYLVPWNINFGCRASLNHCQSKTTTGCKQANLFRNLFPYPSYFCYEELESKFKVNSFW